ncbi:MAG TPA: hypothetical protein DE036_01440 [Actinobacteria bacterium]|nr:hypothetical protein [Actinomycetota bacterium]
MNNPISFIFKASVFYPSGKAVDGLSYLVALLKSRNASSRVFFREVAVYGFLDEIIESKLFSADGGVDFI